VAIPKKNYRTSDCMHLQQQRRKTVVTKRLRTRSTFTPHIQSVTDSISQRVKSSR